MFSFIQAWIKDHLCAGGRKINLDAMASALKEFRIWWREYIIRELK